MPKRTGSLPAHALIPLAARCERFLFRNLVGHLQDTGKHRPVEPVRFNPV